MVNNWTGKHKNEHTHSMALLLQCHNQQVHRTNRLSNIVDMYLSEIVIYTQRIRGKKIQKDDSVSYHKDTTVL